MSFQWLDDFHKEMAKPPDYAQRALAAYRLGMRAGGAIVGVRIEPAKDCCPAAGLLSPNTVYQPDDAPLLPLPECTLRERCGCVYRPVMRYEQPSGE
jgi:hypothetical protein